jgi:hypothetical protein
MISYNHRIPKFGILKMMNAQNKGLKPTTFLTMLPSLKQQAITSCDDKN